MGGRKDKNKDTATQNIDESLSSILCFLIVFHNSISQIFTEASCIQIRQLEVLEKADN